MKNACNQILTSRDVSNIARLRLTKQRSSEDTHKSSHNTHTLPLSMSFKCLRPEDELESGGKILRGRRFAVSASSPFVRPKSPPRSESPGFLTALFTGAGKLLSSVFVFSSSPSSLSSSASDICSASSDDSGYENDDDAYNGFEIDDDDHVSNIRFKEAELNQQRSWFEEKLESRSNLDWDHGPCTLNTAMLPNVTEDEVCSPIDVDKFYTEARWPWASSSSSSIGFKTPIRMYPYNDETSCANACCSFASSEVPENAWKMMCDSDSSEYSIPDSTSIPHNEFEFGVERHATRSQCAFSSSSLGLKSPGFADRISWKSTGFSHCEFAAARTTEACQLRTETSIDFPTTPKIKGRNCMNGPEIDATSDLGWLLRAEPPLNSSHGLARNSTKTFSKKGKKLVSYRRSRAQGK